MLDTGKPQRAQALALVVLGVTACAAPPNVQTPNVSLPQRWETTVAASPAPAQRVAADLSWRDFVMDPRLRALIERALIQSHDIKAAFARIDEARAGYGLAQAERFPAVTLSTQFQSLKAPTSVTATTRSDIERYDLNLNLTAFELDLWGRVASQSAAAQARLLAAREAARTVRMTLITEVSNAYFSLLEIDERIRITREIIRTRETTRDLTEQAVTLGAAARLEQLQVQSVLEASRAELEGLIRQQKSTQNLLDMLVGYSAPELPAGLSLASQSIDAAFATGLPSEILLRRPDVIAAEQRLIEGRANIDAARAAFFPRILLAAGVGVASTALGTLLSGGNMASSIIPSIALPLFDGGRTRSNVSLAEARQSIAVADYERTIRSAFREVADLLAAQSTFRNQKRMAAAEFAIQENRCEVIEARFRAGAASQIEVLEALRQRYAAEQTLVQLRRVELSIGVQLYKALGGGGDLPEVPDLRP